MALTIEATSQKQATVLTCRGIIVFGDEAASLGAYVKKLLSETGSSPPLIILDLSNVQYVDSGGVGALVGLLTSVRSAGSDLKLVGLNDRVKKVLKITHLVDVFKIHASVDDAVKTTPRGATGSAGRR